MEMQFRRLLNLFVVLFVIVSIVLVYWQVIWPTSPASAGQDQNNYLTYKPCVAAETPQRGNIYDRNGVLLAWSEPDQNSPCGWRRRYATDKHPSIGAFMGYYSPIYGASGIEGYYNDQLSGNVPPTDFNAATNQYWNQILHKPIRGQNLYLSIDIRIQDKLDANFENDFSTAQLCDKHQTGSAIIEDPHTGQMLAMDSRPYFNGDTIGDTTPAQDDATKTVGQEYWQQISTDSCAPLISRSVQGQYPPGSIFKTLTLIAALDSGQYTAGSTFTQDEATSATIGGELFNTNNLDAYSLSVEKPSFPMDLAHAYAYSDNVVFARVGAQLGKDTWLNYAQRFLMSTPGNIQPAPIDYQGALPSYAYTHDTPTCPAFCLTQLAASAFGQGQLFLTPMTMSMITSAVAADGMLYAPRLALKIVPDGIDPNTVPNNAPVQLGNGPIFSAQTAQYIRKAMKDVVQFGSIQSSGPNWSPVYTSPNNIGGKTGTGQTSLAHPDVWFMSLAPDDAYANSSAAKLSIVVMKEQGTEGAYESFVAQQMYDFALPLVGH